MNRFFIDGIKHINVVEVEKICMKNTYDEIILDLRTLIEKEPNYSYVAARVLLDKLYLETNRISFKEYIKKGIFLGRLDPRLNNIFDLDTIAKSINMEGDLKFTLLGLQILYDRYLLHDNGVRYEIPQYMFMRVAMGLSLNELNPTQKAIEFYELLSSFDYMCSTPTLFNAGTTHPQLSSCYLSHVPDNLEGIYDAIKDNALLSKYAGGLGNDWTAVRANGARIKGTNGKSQGVVPFLHVTNASLIAVNQGGKRKGAGCAYLEVWHKDIYDFLELRKNTGDERRRTHDMNTAVWIPDLFMERVHDNGEWTLFSPHEVPDLHDLYGAEFKDQYQRWEKYFKANNLGARTVKAIDLWRKILSMLYETGHPWITFKDPCNLRSPQKHCGVVHSSNLCTEITLNTSENEIAVCNLGSINLANHIRNGRLDQDQLEKTVTTAVRMLDNVIDINFYPVDKARESNLKHRPIGLGCMGFQDVLYKMGISYDSPEAVDMADFIQECISYNAINASCDLAIERGRYESFFGSDWYRGMLPIFSTKFVKHNRRPEHFKFIGLENRHYYFYWEVLAAKIRMYGMRNSNVMAIAPTATIANICGVTQSIEPSFQNLYVKSNLSGEFTIVNTHLVEELRGLGLWDEQMLQDLKYHNGSVQKIDRIPIKLKSIYKTAFEIDPKKLIECAAGRQKWIDQAQSLNLYLANPSGKMLDEIYKYAWIMGLKTTYYLRTLGASNAEKVTINDTLLNAVTCNIDDPDCEACQ